MRTCVSTCARGAGIHGRFECTYADVLNVRTKVSPVCHTTHHTAHTPQHKTRHTTIHGDRDRIQIKRDRERERETREDERRKTKEDKTNEERQETRDKRRQEERIEEKRRPRDEEIKRRIKMKERRREIRCVVCGICSSVESRAGAQEPHQYYCGGLWKVPCGYSSRSQ